VNQLLLLQFDQSKRIERFTNLMSWIVNIIALKVKNFLKLLIIEPKLLYLFDKHTEIIKKPLIIEK